MLSSETGEFSFFMSLLIGLLTVVTFPLQNWPGPHSEKAKPVPAHSDLCVVLSYHITGRGPFNYSWYAVSLTNSTSS